MTDARSQDAEFESAPSPRLLWLPHLAGWAITGLFLLLLALGPLPLGANRDWAWAPMALVIGALAILSAVGWGNRAALEVNAEERWPLLLLVLCFAIVVAVALLQMSTWAPLTASAVYYA